MHCGKYSRGTCQLGLMFTKKKSDPTFTTQFFMGIIFYFMNFFDFLVKKLRKKHFFCEKFTYFNFKLQILIKNSFKLKKFRSLTPLEIQFYLLGGVFRPVYSLFTACLQSVYTMYTMLVSGIN